MIFLFGIVWATDICGYFVGRFIGGPKLCRASVPRRPGRARSAALSARSCRACDRAVCPSAEFARDRARRPATLRRVAAGDLFESAFKRRFGVKDADMSFRATRDHGPARCFLAAAVAAAVIGILRSGFARPRAVFWCGEVEDRGDAMTSAVPLSRSDRQSAPATRSITDSGRHRVDRHEHVDLIKRNRGRYRVVAVTAARNAAALARLARDLNASFARSPTRLLRRAQVALAGTGIEAARAKPRWFEAALASSDWDGRDHGRRRLAADARRRRERHDRGARQQGNPGVRGKLFMRRAAAAGATVLPVDSEHNAIFQALGAGTARTCIASS